MRKYLKYIPAILLPIFISFWNRQRGTDSEDRFLNIRKDVLFLLLGAIITGAFYLPIHASWGWLGIGVASLLITASLALIYAPTWGELFPHSFKNTSNEKFAPLIKPITNILTGYKYTTETPKDKEVVWKTVGMSVRWTLYSIPHFIILSIATKSLIPLIGILFKTLAGPIYRVWHKKQEAEYSKTGLVDFDATAYAEYTLGFLIGLGYTVIYLWMN